ncbi:hypothetical protein E2562_037211 [Oryza meyeriana var. granulata]|uniref:Uncharacterized protein n=1 Tax=Oryza meyeriana var. granulata TaxID=110450 RepID=A0A6G1E8M8_9ORYZ|nr:hypothetical protein E2562_037211 [Oryza meyeriana var. granulata]
MALPPPARTVADYYLPPSAALQRRLAVALGNQRQAPVTSSKSRSTSICPCVASGLSAVLGSNEQQLLSPD